MQDFGIGIARNSDWTYSVTVTFRPIMEDMFETATHVARFKTEVGARKLAAAVKARFLARADKSLGVLGTLDKRYWQGPTSVCAPVRWDAEVAPYCVFTPATH